MCYKMPSVISNALALPSLSFLLEKASDHPAD
jgi:hypothetical protein